MKPLIPYFEPFEIPISGEFGIHGFGILVALGFVFGAQVAMRKARRDGLEPELINKFVFWVVVGVFAGGHLGHLLMYYPRDLIENPRVIFEVWHGLSSFGGFIACAAIGIWFYLREAKRVRAENRAREAAGKALLPPVHIWGFADALLYGFAFAWFWGRMGCFSAHDHAGSETDFWLGVYGMCPHPTGQPDLGVACHDLGLYEGLYALFMFAVFVPLDRKPRFPGFFTGAWFVLYAPFRFVLDFFRHPETDPRYFGLTPAQYGCVVMLAIGVWMLWARRKLAPLRPVAVAGRAEGG